MHQSFSCCYSLVLHSLIIVLLLCLDLCFSACSSIFYYHSVYVFFFFSSRRRHTRLQGDWSSDVCSSDLPRRPVEGAPARSPSRLGARARTARCHLRPEHGGDRGGAGAPLPRDPSGAGRQIGRASCRERV